MASNYNWSTGLRADEIDPANQSHIWRLKTRISAGLVLIRHDNGATITTSQLQKFAAQLKHPMVCEYAKRRIPELLRDSTGSGSALDRLVELVHYQPPLTAEATDHDKDMNGGHQNARTKPPPVLFRTDAKASDDDMQKQGRVLDFLQVYRK